MASQMQGNNEQNESLSLYENNSPRDHHNLDVLADSISKQYTFAKDKLLKYFHIYLAAARDPDILLTLAFYFFENIGEVLPSDFPGKSLPNTLSDAAVLLCLEIFADKDCPLYAIYASNTLALLMQYISVHIPTDNFYNLLSLPKAREQAIEALKQRYLDLVDDTRTQIRMVFEQGHSATAMLIFIEKMRNLSLPFEPSDFSDNICPPTPFEQLMKLYKEVLSIEPNNQDAKDEIRELEVSRNPNALSTFGFFGAIHKQPLNQVESICINANRPL